MLTNTFCHLPGVGAKTERELWAAGACSWEQVATVEGRRAAMIAPRLEESRERLQQGDAAFFAERLPANQHWRLFSHFRPRAAYLDIETTGLGGYGDHITTIALYDGTTIRHYVYGENLDDFPQDIRAYDLLVSFNGKTFDVPFIESHFRIKLHTPHIDLRYVLAALGYKGGLKQIERALGYDRGDLADIDGYFAVILWQDYRKTKNRAALDTLLAYNILDTVNLESLMVRAYNLHLATTPFADALQLPTPAVPPIPFAPDMATVTRLRRYATGGW